MRIEVGQSLSEKPQVFWRILMQTKRFQLDLSEQEHVEMERLMAHAGIKTKREFVSNALTLFKWAAMEMLQGRTIASADAKGSLKELQMPVFQNFTGIGLEELLLSNEEVRRRSQEPSRKLIDREKFLEERADEHLAGTGVG